MSTQKSLFPIILGSCAAILLFGAGYFVGAHANPRQFRVTLVAGDADVFSEPPPMEEWRYPDSRVEKSQAVAGRKFNDLDVTAPAEFRVLSTADDFGKVWSFYQKKCDLQAAGSSVSAKFSDSAVPDGIIVTVFDDKVKEVFEGLKSDSMQSRGFTVSCPRYVLTGFIYRSRDSDATCIILAYRPNKDYLGLARLHLPKP